MPSRILQYVFAAYVGALCPLADAQQATPTLQPEASTSPIPAPVASAISPASAPASGAVSSIPDSQESQSLAENVLASVLRLFSINWSNERHLQRAQIVVQMLSSLLLFLSLVVALVSLLVALFVALLNRANAQVDAFIKLRTAFSLVRTDLLKEDLLCPKQLPSDPAKLRLMQRYWYQSFDEWFITRKLHRFTLGKLWSSYYKDAIAHAAKNRHMLQALDLAREDSSNPIDVEFVQVVKKLLPKQHGESANPQPSSEQGDAGATAGQSGASANRG